MQRAIEAAGLPTILITVDPAQSAQARPPRAVYPVHHGIGFPVGPAGDAAEQRRTLEAAFNALTDPIEPGTIREIS